MAPIEERPTSDEILASVREAKFRLAALQEFDIHRIIADARQRQSQSGHQVLEPQPRRRGNRFVPQGVSS